MCSEVEVRRGDDVTDCSTHGQLAVAVGLSVAQIPQLHPVPPCAAPVGELDCLCNVDIAALGGRKATDDQGWPFPEWVIELPKGDIG